MCKALVFLLFAGLALATVAATTDDVEVQRKYPFVTRKLRQFGWVSDLVPVLDDIDPSAGESGPRSTYSTTPRGDGAYESGGWYTTPSGTEVTYSTTERGEGAYDDSQGVYEAGGGADSYGNSWGYERNPDGTGSDWFVTAPGGD